jgi:hypothetical protein
LRGGRLSTPKRRRASWRDVGADPGVGAPPGLVAASPGRAGPGVAVLDLFESYVIQPRPIGIVVTTGYETTQKQPWKWHTPKKNLVVHLQAAADARPEPCLHLGPRLPFYEAVVQEMQSLRADTNPQTGYVKYEADRLQAHDDLLFALGCCVWWGDVMGDSNWRPNVHITRAADGSLVHRRPQMVKQRRVFLDDVPVEQPFDEQAWQETLRTAGEDPDSFDLGPRPPQR